MFKIGDKVTCIAKPTNCPINTFNGDNVFTVVAIDVNKEGHQTICIKNSSNVLVGWWLSARFILI